MTDRPPFDQLTGPASLPLSIPAGSGGGGKKNRGSGGGGSGASAPPSVEQPNSLRSKQLARVIDLLGEGPMGGVPNFQNVWFDGVQVMGNDGNWNFNTIQAAQYTGWPGQPVLPGFYDQQAETAVGLQVKTTSTIVRSILDTNADWVRVTVSVPALSVTDKKTGNVNGTGVEFAIDQQSNGGGWMNVGGAQAISGKTNTRYQRAYTFELYGSGPWEIRVRRLTPDSTTLEVVNDLYWDSYTAIINSRVTYSNSAVFGITVDAEQFQSIPKRVYRAFGLYMWVPSNYDSRNRTYAGVWDGTFKFDWCSNPAWILFDLIRNSRYGLGQFITYDQIDKWSFYKIGQWCDGWVPNGKGGWEPRWVCNAVINDRQEAFDLLNSFAAIFRGFMFWSGGTLAISADMPADAVGLYTQANVVDGSFNYQGGDLRSRHTVAHVSWNDPENLGEPRIAVVEDDEAVRKWGINKLDIVAIGCTSEGQAIRTGKWALFTEQMESDTVTFRTGIETAWVLPGNVIKIADPNVAGERRGGRIVYVEPADASHVGFTILHIDAPMMFQKNTYYSLSVSMPSGKVVSTQCNGYDVQVTGGETTKIIFGNQTEIPAVDSVWVIASSDLEAQTWRVLTVTEPERGVYEITAIPYNTSKWDYIERNLILQVPDISNLGVPKIVSVVISDFIVALSAVSLGVRMLISWQSNANGFEVQYRPLNGNWTTVRTVQQSLEVPVEELTYEVWITPLSTIGQRGVVAKNNYTVIGKSAPPEDVRNFRVQSVQGVAMFQWAPIRDIDVVVGGTFEMRYSPQTSGVTWTSANTVLTSIPGTATSVELPYRAGTYLIRARDITGLMSTNAAVVSTTAPDMFFRPYYQICENPDWLGSRINTEVKMPQNWLVLGATGGMWDAQTANIDTWGLTDVLPGDAGLPPTEGRYTFEDHIDMGGVFPVRLTVDMLAFPYLSGTVFFDERTGYCDDWQSWDDLGDPGNAMVTIEYRQSNDDPTSGSASWTEWKQFISGEFNGRGFQFRAWLTAAEGEAIAIEQLCILADVSQKSEQGADIPWANAKMHITFAVKFLTIPALSIAVQQGLVDDTFRITNKTRLGFDLELLNNGSIITGGAARVFDWQAQGY